MREVRRKMRKGWNVVVIVDIYPREVGVRRAIPRWGEGRRWNTWTRGGLGRTEAWGKGFGII